MYERDSISFLKDGIPFFCLLQISIAVQTGTIV